MPTSCLTPAGFDALPMPRKAILIALDVLEQLRSKIWLVRTDSYITGDFRNSSYFPRMLHKSTTDEAVKKKIKSVSCSVCAKGALFLTGIMRSNKMTLLEAQESVSQGAASSNAAIIKKLVEVDQIFTKENIDLIEIAFEGSCCGMSKDSNIPREDIDSARDFYTRYDSADHRLAAICLNIYRNKGTFIPSGYRPTLKNVKRALVMK